MQPVIHAINDALQNPSSKWNALVSKCDITATLPIRDPSTGQPKIMYFSRGTKTMKVSCIVSIRDDVAENTEQNGSAWCHMLVREINEKFDVKIAFGGNASHYGADDMSSLESQFLTDDVVNLALMSYQDSIENGSFFLDTVLVNQYFSHTRDVKGLFAKLFAM